LKYQQIIESLQHKIIMTDKGRYDKRGVSSQKEDVHKAIKNTDKGVFPNAFCKVVEDVLGSDPEWCNVVHADGAGTKSSLAYIYWKETGDMSVWKGIAQDAMVMNLDDLLCLGVTGPFLMSNTIGRNKHLIPGDVIAAIIEGMEQFCADMKALGIQIISTGGETADVGDLVRTLIVDSTFTGRFKRNQIKEINIHPGDVIVGLSSHGQTHYEKEYNAGMGSNGLTSARHDLLNKYYAEKYPESYDNGTVPEYIYSGPFRLLDQPVGLPFNVGKAILSPTRTFAPFFSKLTQAEMDEIHGIIHCTGGGQTKVLKFCGNVHIIKDKLMEIPPLFRHIQQASGATTREMFEVFNMGHRMEFYTRAENAENLINIALGLGIQAQIIGRVEDSNVKQLTVFSNNEKLIWN
jgi:phosphoribosylformylglycinamidine cyclo-ligase